MNSHSLSIGIDHGTSNSGIAIMENSGPRVIKTNGVDEIMPSVVYMDHRGRTIIGAAAYRAMYSNKPHEGDGCTGYKLRIGQGDRYEFAAAKKTLTAPELGGLVIGALLKAYQEDSGETPQAAVITVPAKFEHNACDGTREAARLAGLRCYPLLQEPIAAAMAYGFTATDRKAQWMIFDLGGGTLDVSLVFVKDGQMVVPEEGHAGDNRLGGRKFDREIFDYALAELKKQYALDRFSEKNPDYKQAWGRLLIACEQAKIELSNREQSTIEVTDTLCKDGKGKDVRAFIPITQAQYQKMIAALVEQFLRDRGLQLSPEKTCITHIEEGFDFLGQNLRKYDGKLLIKPSKKNTHTFLEKVRTIIQENRTATQEILIRQLNPVIRGWANYHQSIVAADTFNRVDHVLWQSLWRWAKRRHPNKSGQWVMRKYWHTIGQRSWVFAVDTGDRTPSDQIVWLRLRQAADTKIRRHPQIKGTANPFDPRWHRYFADRAFLKRFGIHRGEAGIKTL